MFFSQIVLAKRGALGKIWLAGHWDKKLAKNVVFKTNIPKSVKTILNPHSPMALRMTSHLLLGVARIFSKKAKYLLSDCTEAVIKLKGLSKTISKIDLPSEQDHQALLTSGPRQTDKPQVYQEVDRFLRNIDIRDLVVDPLYDPNKLEPTEKPDYSEFFGVADGSVLGSVQTPLNDGNNLVFDGTTTVTPQSDRRFKSDELREQEYSTMVSTPDTSGLPFGQGKTPKTPDSVKSNIDILISDNQNPLFNYSATTPLPKSQRELMEDAGMVTFDEGMNQPQDGDEHVDIGMRHDDDYPAYTGPDVRDDGDQQQEQFDENGQPVTPGKSVTTDKTSEAGGDSTTAAAVGTTAATTATATDGVAVEEKSEIEIQQLQQQLLLEKQKEQSEKDKPKTRRSRVLGSTLSDKDVRKFKNTRSLIVERPLLPPSLSVVISKSKEIPAKQQMLTAIRKNISKTFHRAYGETIDNRYPKIISKEEDPYFSYLRSRLMYGRMIKNEELVMSMAADGVSSLDLGIPTFEDLEIDENQERKVEEAFLKSINNRVITESGNLIAPSERKKLKTQPLTDDDKDLINRLRTEFDDRSKNRKSLFYKPDINQTLRGMGGFGEDEATRDVGDKSIGSPDGSDFLKRAKEEEERERLRREEGDMGQHFMHGGDDDHQGIGLGYDQEEPGFVHPGDLGDVPEYSFESAQKPNQPTLYKEHEEEKKILSQKTANMHSILSDHFQKKDTINFLQDIVRPQQVQNPNNTRLVAACYFYELLVLKTKVLINLEQPENDTETYPDIKISKTSQFGNIEQFTIVKNAD
ncbi:hypothetical protein RB653_003153 [Dictyostelium firmibasis]|uniref:Double-strand-break repair protein rad21 homolog n=1 Tax=Dictyostelium firmibasis TaxID=79012 RepID=A0AAN7TZG7_9MYCE